MRLNNNPPPDITAIQITEDRLTFELEDGRSVSAPLTFYPTLLLASPEERSEYEIVHSSVYWPKLDCDLSSDGLLRGNREARKHTRLAWRRKSKPGG